MKRFLSLFLVVLIILPIVAITFTGCVQKADYEWILPTEQFINTEFELSDEVYVRDGMQGENANYYLAEQNDNYALYINKERLDIALLHKQSGEVWFSNPTDDVINSNVGKSSELKSQIIITFLDKTNEAQQIWNSYNECVRNYAKTAKGYEGADEDVIKRLPYYLTQGKDNNLRVKYLIGETLTDYIIPTVISGDVYDELFAMCEDENFCAAHEDINKFYLKNNFRKLTYETLTDTKRTPTEQRAEYEALAPGLKKLEPEGETVYLLSNTAVWDNPLLATKLQSAFDGWFEFTQLEGIKDIDGEPAENFADLRTAWDEKFEVAERSVNVFCISLDYILEDDGLKVAIDNENIIFNQTRYEISHLDVLKYFGSAPATETNGYMITPDGSGAKINFSNGKVSLTSEIKVDLYGIDRGKDYTKMPDKIEQGYLPVFGIKKANSAMLAIIEDGDNIATVISDVPRSTKNTVNYTYSSYRFVEYDDMALYGATKNLRTYQLERYTGSIAIKYSILGGDVDYADMATYYREYMLKNNQLTKTENNLDNINFNLELVGALGDTSAFMGIQYDYLNALTTYEQAIDILSQLKAGGVNAINLRYRGASNNGMENQSFDSFRPLAELGGEAGYKALMDYANTNGIKLYPETEIIKVYKDKLFDGYMKYFDVSRMLNRSNCIYTQYNLMQTANYMKQAFISRPQKVKSMSESLLKDLKARGINSVSLGSIGSMLTGDYHINDAYDRDEVQTIYTEVLKNYKDNGMNIAVEGGNLYALAGTDVIYDLPNSSSNYYMADETIPFYQIAVHGYVQYSGEYINQTGESNKTLLQAVEYGAGLAYKWMAAPNEAIRNIYFEDVYAINYEGWIEIAIADYTAYNQALKETASQTITDHALVDDLHITVYNHSTFTIVNYGDEAAEITGARLLECGVDSKAIKADKTYKVDSMGYTVVKEGE